MTQLHSMLCRALGTAATLAAMGCLGVGSAHAQASNSRQAATKRAAEFTQWQRSHTDEIGKIADLKAKTREEISSYVPPLVLDGAGLDYPPILWRVPGSVVELWDNVDAPRMVIVPAGEYTMGSMPREPGREESEGPRHRVRIGYAFAVSRYPVTVAEYARFVEKTGYQPKVITDTPYSARHVCFSFFKTQWRQLNGCDWRHPPFSQSESDPVVAVSWDDAQAYAAWLSKTTGHSYRLLSEAEYEYAARAGTTSPYWWGAASVALCSYANGADLDAKAEFPDWSVSDCRDGFVATAPVGRFKPNPFGLYDMAGNVWSWVQDCWVDNYIGAPADGSANLSGDCGFRAARGGAWADSPAMLRTAARGHNFQSYRAGVNGFRVARDL